MHFVAQRDLLSFLPSHPGNVFLYDTDFRELARRSDLNFRPNLVADIQPGRRYFVVYRKWQEFGAPINFEINF